VISYPDHHTHGWYIIKNSNLIGFQAAEIDILASTVAYHRKKSRRKMILICAVLKSQIAASCGS
jgi:exopolyphosphatase/pppGpp-phosphohydrolase